ncbi:MAG: hypothetical protein QM753_10340 [Thermomicrobiales bacterium]
MSMPPLTPTPPASQLPGWALPAFQWLTVVNAILIVVQAFLASQGFWNNERSLITGHGQLGNAVFLLVVIQGVLAVMLVNGGVMPRPVMLLAGLSVVLIVAQIGLGYSTRNDFTITAGTSRMGCC